MTQIIVVEAVNTSGRSSLVAVAKATSLVECVFGKPKEVLNVKATVTVVVDGALHTIPG